MEKNFTETRRDVLRKAVFVSPLILTLPVLPSFAKAGSQSGHDPAASGNYENGSDESHNSRRRRHHSGFWSWLGL
jgi:hypothetical protein